MYCTNILALTFRLYNTTPWEKKLYIYACAESRRLPNESRFNDTSLALTRFDSLEKTGLVENHLSSDSYIVTIKNWVVSQKP